MRTRADVEEALEVAEAGPAPDADVRGAPVDGDAYRRPGPLAHVSARVQPDPPIRLGGVELRGGGGAAPQVERLAPGGAGVGHDAALSRGHGQALALERLVGVGDRRGRDRDQEP